MHSDNYVSITQIATAPGLKRSKQAVRKQADKEGWGKRKVEQGKGFEYRIESLPNEIQQALSVHDAIQNHEPEKARKPSDQLWNEYAKNVTATNRSRAEARLIALRAAIDYIEAGMAKSQAWQRAAKEHGMSRSAIYAYWHRVKDYDMTDWLPLLVSHSKGSKESSESPQEVFDYFNDLYLTPEKRTFTHCYRLTKQIAEMNNWPVPSLDTIKRRLKKHIPHVEQVIRREGSYAAMRLYPSQRRTVADLYPMQSINGDGYQHNLFIKWPNGDIKRPKTWFWQDIYSRRIVGWRTALSENTDLIRLSFADVVSEFGIPEYVTHDNTTAAANYTMTGGSSKSRKRFKSKDEMDDEMKGVYYSIGVKKVVFTSIIEGKGHGQAKPIERAFGDGGIADVDRHPAFTGCYTGNDPKAKPDNYGERAVDLAEFIKILSDGVNEFNTRLGRKTEMAAGVKSYDGVFVDDYRPDLLRRPTRDQQRIYLLASEIVRVQREGDFTIKAGSAVGLGRNRYACTYLHDYIGQHIVVRFDPQNLHTETYCYSKKGELIGTARLIDDAGFHDTRVSREHNKERRSWLKANKASAKARQRMEALEIAKQLPITESPDTPDNKVVLPYRPDVSVPAPEVTMTDDELKAHDEFVKRFDESLAAQTNTEEKDLEAEIASRMNSVENVVSITAATPRDDRTIYADWMVLERKVDSGEITDPAIHRKLERYKTTASYRTWKELFEDNELDIVEFASTKKAGV